MFAQAERSLFFWTDEQGRPTFNQQLSTLRAAWSDQ